MVKIPTPEETAIEILAIFVNHFKSRTGNVLGLGNFLSVWHNRGLAADDFKAGMEYAAQQGWVDILPGGESFKLTELGFSKA